MTVFRQLWKEGRDYVLCTSVYLATQQSNFISHFPISLGNGYYPGFIK